MNVEEARAYLLGAEKGAQIFAHVLAGVNAGLFEAIARHGESGVHPDALAGELDYTPDYVRVWCETAYALLVLDDAGGGRFRLADGFEPLLTAGSPGSALGYLCVRETFVRERFELPEFLRTGAIRPYGEHGTALSLAVAELTGRWAEVLAEEVYRANPDVAARLGPGARVLEVGCGTARLPVALARVFPGASFDGIDPDGPAIEKGRREIEEAGLQARIRLEQWGAETLDAHEEYDLVSLCVVMHELRDEIRPQAVHNMWQALRPGGILVSVDQYYPSRLGDYRNGEFYIAVMDQAAEVIWGNRHLSKEGLAALFAASGFSRSEFSVVQLPGQPSPRLVALAHK